MPRDPNLERVAEDGRPIAENRNLFTRLRLIPPVSQLQDAEDWEDVPGLDVSGALANEANNVELSESQMIANKRRVLSRLPAEEITMKLLLYFLALNLQTSAAAETPKSWSEWLTAGTSLALVEKTEGSESLDYALLVASIALLPTQTGNIKKRSLRSVERSPEMQ